MKGIGLDISLISYINKRNTLFFILSVGAVGMVYTPLRDLLTTAERSEYYSHILLIPLVSGFLLYTKEGFGVRLAILRFIVELAGVCLSKGNMSP